MPELKDLKTALDHLESQGMYLQITVAARSALRALERLRKVEDPSFPDLSLAALRATLCACVGASKLSLGGLDPVSGYRAHAQNAVMGLIGFSGRYPNTEQDHALQAALRAAHTIVSEDGASRGGSAAHALNHAAQSLQKTGINGKFWQTVSLEASFARVGSREESIQQVKEFFSRPLWSSGVRNELAKVPSDLLHLWASDARTWDFWARWYDGMLNGKPLPWDLQEKVALIPDEDWQNGPAHVAGLIRRIQFSHLTNVDRSAVYDEDTGRFGLESLTKFPDGPLSFARDRIQMALDNALSSGTANGLTEDSYETRVIRTAVENHPEDGSLLAVSFFDACMSFQRRIGDVYPEDTSLIILKNALYTTCEEITELDETAKARVQRLVALGKPTIVPATDREDVAKIPEALSDLTNDELDARIREASDIVASADNPPSSVRARLANWVTTITIWMDKAMKGDKRITWLAKLVERMRDWWPDAD